MSEGRLCSKCGVEPARPGQRWGADCHNAYRRDRHVRHVNGAVNASGASGPGTTGEGGRETPAPPGLLQKGKTFTATVPEWALEEPKPFVPYRAREAAQPWYRAYLCHYAVHGGKALAASAAGVTSREVRKHRRKSNVLAYFDRMKAEMPGRHVDKALIGAISVNVGVGSSNADGLAALRAMFGDASPETRALIQGTPLVIDVPALPEGDPLQ